LQSRFTVKRPGLKQTQIVSVSIQIKSACYDFLSGSVKIDIKIGLAETAKGAEIAKPLKIAERTLSFFLCALCVLCEKLW